ncbi:hypothetical protein L7F22_014274 [Adiantum nelumboides]|nr:hypothetical protein [Adiantum nelumboides]
MPLHERVVVSACFVWLLTLIFVLCARPISALASNETSSWPAAEILHTDHHMLAWRLRQSSADSVVFQPWRIVCGLLCGSLATALSSAGGIGGGGLYVPIFNLLLGFSSKTSAALSSCMIVGGTLVNIFWYAFQKDASGLGPLVDYEVVLLCLPNVLLGISIGVMCNVAAPSWLVTVLLIFVLFFMTFRSCRNAIQRWNVESSYSVQSELLIRLNLPNDEATCDREDALFPPPSSNFASESHLHRKLSKDEDLEMPLLGSHLSEIKPQFPSVKIAMLCLIWIAFLAVQLVRGSSDGQNFFGIETCGTIFWIVTLVQLPMAMVITALVFHFQRSTKKDRGIAASDEAVSLMESGSRTLFPVYALVAGFLGGMLGLGGGMIISPLFLEMGMHPQTTAATCSYMVFFSSSLSVVQFWLLGRIPQLYALASACVALVFSVTGILVIHAVISKYGRVSLIVFSVSTVMAISAVMMACFGEKVVMAIVKSQESFFYIECSEGTSPAVGGCGAHSTALCARFLSSLAMDSNLRKSPRNAARQISPTNTRHYPAKRQKFQLLPKISRFGYPKDVEVPLKAFCTTNEDFHREHGLRFKGKDVKKLTDADVSMSDWLKVFTCLPVKEKKVPIKTARPDHYKALYELYKQVYQSKPPNYLLGVKFACGYVYFVCRGPIKWAEFASEVVKNVTNEGHLNRKRKQWKLVTSQVSTATPSGSAILLVNTPSGSTPVESELFATTQFAFSVEVSTSLQELLVEVTKSHDNVSAECQKTKDSVVKSVADVHRCEGAIDTIRIHFPDDANVPTGLLDSLQEKFDQANATLQ